MLKSMILSEIDIPFLIRLLPFSRYSYIKKQVEKHLKSRCDTEVEGAWMDVGISYESIKNILNIVAKYCDWKSIKFIPSDELSCVFIDHDLDMGAIVAMSEIEKTCPQIKPGQLYECIKPKSDLLCLVRFILTVGN